MIATPNRPTPTRPQLPEGPPRFQALARTLLTMKVPEGYRAEIIGGNIVMSPWPKAYHLHVVRSLRTQLEPHLRPGWLVDSSPCLFTFPRQEQAYSPDVFVASEQAFRTSDRHIDCAALTLAADLTSGPTRAVDWLDQLPMYGKAGVPVYLLLDMREHAISVFSTPTPLGYAERRTVGFGDELPLPEPFGFALETIGFGDVPEDEREGADKEV